MLTRTEALEIVSKRLQEMNSSGEPFVLVENSTIEKPFGWVFFYNSKRFLETGENSSRLAGNGPVIVNKHSGSVEFFGSARPLIEILAEYEKRFDH
jgi:hypothetical protein